MLSFPNFPASVFNTNNYVRSNIGRDFLKLIDKHFPKTNELHKIFNHNTVKVSYSCMENVSITSITRIASKHNTRVLNNMKGMKAKSEVQRNCSCRSHEECPLHARKLFDKKHRIQDRSDVKGKSSS